MIKSSKNNQVPSAISNRILQGTKIEGDIYSDGDFRLDGEIVGKVDIKGKFVIGEKGKLKGEVFCAQATISGNFSGSLIATESLTLTESAVVHGEIKTEKLSIEPGAEFTGNCQMGGVIREIKDKQSAKSENKSGKTA
ncbi:MAG: polymer-forming cytoskeletal protein [Flavobacteriales bacterium]|nr:MAG: polymer-forming cytoskeletal protein [Flavobacteriales bacterium]